MVYRVGASAGVEGELAQQLVRWSQRFMCRRRRRNGQMIAGLLAHLGAGATAAAAALLGGLWQDAGVSENDGRCRVSAVSSRVRSGARRPDRSIVIPPRGLKLPILSALL